MSNDSHPSIIELMLITRIDSVLIPILRRWSVPLLRVSLAVVFIWFGVLKIIGSSPVVDLVASTVYWFDPDWFVPLLGVVELLVGVGLLFGRVLRLVLLVLTAQMAGTFLVFIILPDLAFEGGNPLSLSVEGEFVLKNLVLLAAALVVGAGLRPGEKGAAEVLQPADED